MSEQNNYRGNALTQETLSEIQTLIEKHGTDVRNWTLPVLEMRHSFPERNALGDNPLTREPYYLTGKVHYSIDGVEVSEERFEEVAAALMRLTAPLYPVEIQNS